MCLNVYVLTDNRCQSVTVTGVHYKAGSVVRISSSISSTVTYMYGVICEFIVCEGEKMIAVKYLERMSFNKVRWAWVVRYPDSDVHLVSFQSLHCHGTLPLLSKEGQYYVIDKNYNVKNLWSLL